MRRNRPARLHSAASSRAAVGSGRRSGRILPRVLIGTGLLFVAVAGGWQLNASLWMAHYHRVGGALVHQEQVRLTAVANETPVERAASCNSTLSTSGPQGLLEIPELGVTAPVEQGETDQVLSVAVGHDTASVWPGSNGTAVLTSHDVTYFVNIDHLKAGQILSYVMPCTTYQFKVTTQKVVEAGAAIYNTPGSSIALVTCWPTNALFYTNQRLVVFLTKVSSTSVKKANSITGSSGGVLTSDAKQPTVPVPKALATQGLTLATNYAPMGTLTILGNPNPRYVQSPAPLLAQDAALVAYFGGLKALAEGHTDWWKQFAPGVKPPAALIGNSVGSYPSSVNVYIEAHGYAVTGVAIKDTVRIGGATFPMQIGMAISSKNVLTITSWTT